MGSIGIDAILESLEKGFKVLRKERAVIRKADAVPSAGWSRQGSDWLQPSSFRPTAIARGMPLSS